MKVYYKIFIGDKMFISEPFEHDGSAESLRKQEKILKDKYPAAVLCPHIFNKEDEK